MMHSELDALSSFEAARRRRALEDLAAKQTRWPPETSRLNMHLHTFFSFNGEGWSPSRIAWEARQQGLYSIAICDFDVLEGLEELQAAADLLRLRATTGFESRTFFAEYADREINSPGEPGVFYFMGMGFTSRPAPGSDASAVLEDMLERAHARNRALIGRINARLGDLALDYEADVLPLTPAGNATERHIVLAYRNKALEQADGVPAKAAAVWAEKLGLDAEETALARQNDNAFADLLRSKLMKRGGLGYQQPTPDTFPPLDTVIAMIRACRAIPMSTWLDGISAGESDPNTQLDCLMAKGVAAVNIIPDRNWNIKDPEEKARKVAALNRYIDAARKRHLPVNVGTELNKPGQRFVDDFSAPALRPHHPLFIEGAQIMIGHDRLRRYADTSYIDASMTEAFPDPAARNAFFAAVGALPAPDAETRRKLEEMEPSRAFAWIVDCSRRKSW